MKREIDFDTGWKIKKMRIRPHWLFLILSIGPGLACVACWYWVLTKLL